MSLLDKGRKDKIDTAKRKETVSARVEEVGHYTDDGAWWETTGHKLYVRVLFEKDSDKGWQYYTEEKVAKYLVENV